MIGSEQFTVIRPSTFIFSGTAGAVKVPTTQPPATGCYLRLEGLITGVAGNVIITGTATDNSVTETILSTSFDSDKIAVSAKKWQTISNINIAASWVSMVIYPASTSGDKINFGSGSYTSFSILADCYDINQNQFRGYYQELGGEVNKSFKGLMYDGRFTLYAEDLTTIFGKQYKVVDVESQHGLYSALLATMR